MTESSRVALVTGAVRGIGRAIALTLAQPGLTLYLNDVVLGEEAEKTKEEVAAQGADARLLQFNVADTEETQAGIDRIIKESGRLDVLVNNAGITRDNLALRMKLEDWRAVLDANLTGAFLCTKECLRHMVKARQGAVVNISSVVGALGNPGQANYCASKAGLEGMTRSLAREYANRNIRVNAVAPGFIETDMTEALGEKAREALLEQVPLARLGTGQDVAEAVAFLASDRAAYITGHVLQVNGGMYMG